MVSKKKMVVVVVFTCLLFALVFGSNNAADSGTVAPSDKFHVVNTEQSSSMGQAKETTTKVHVSTTTNTNTYNSHKHLMLLRKLHDQEPISSCGGQKCKGDEDCDQYGDECACLDLGEGLKCYLDVPCDESKTCTSDDDCTTETNYLCKCDKLGTGNCYDEQEHQED